MLTPDQRAEYLATGFQAGLIVRELEDVTFFSSGTIADLEEATTLVARGFKLGQSASTDLNDDLSVPAPKEKR